MNEIMIYCIPKLKENHPCNYYSDDRCTPLVRTIDLLKEQILHYTSERFEALMLISGSIVLHTTEGEEITVSEKQLFLLPDGHELTVQSLETSQLIVCGLTEEVKLCVKSEISDHLPPIGKVDQSIHILPFKPPIAKFAESLTMAMKSGISCEIYLNCKFTELMFLLGTYYPEAEQAKLFRVLLRERSDFQIKISKIEGEVKTAKEMAEKCYMTEVGFRKRFKHEMGIPPGEYLIQRKKRLLAEDLRRGVKNNSDLCFEYGFNSASALTNFCRAHLGSTPSELRKGKKLAVNKQEELESALA